MKIEHEDWLSDLPPLDGDNDDPESDEAGGDDLPSGGEDEVSLDDAASEELELDEAIEISEEGSADPDDENWEADIGEAELDVVEGGDAESSEADPAAFGEVDIDEPPAGPEDDGGAEGTSDPIEQAIDDELPPLDADDEGDFQDDWTYDTEGAIATTRPSMRWADAAWEERPHSALVFAWGADPEEPVATIAVSGGAGVMLAAAAHAPGEVWLSRDEGRSASRIHLDAPWLGVPGRAGPLLFAASGDHRHPVLWAMSSGGELARSADLGRTWIRAAGVGRPVLAFATHQDGSLSALAQRGSTTELLTSTDGARWFAARVSVSLRPARGGVGGGCWLALAGSAVAIGDASGVWLSRDGQHFVRVPGSAGATAGAFAGHGSDAPLVLAGELGEQPETYYLVRAQEGTPPEILAEVGMHDGDDEPRVLALNWDSAGRAMQLWFCDRVRSWGATS